jgi:hypothetical protein
MYSCLYRLFAQFFALSYVNFEGCDVICGVEKGFQGCVPVFEVFTIQGQYYWNRRCQCTLPQLLFVLCM